MRWLINFFKKKTQETLKGDKKWLDGYHAFEAGKEYFLNGRYNEALEQLDKAIENGFEGQVFGLRGTCLQWLEFYYDAIADFDKAISLSSNDCGFYFSRSVCKGAIQDFEGEITDLAKAIELSKEDNELNRGYNEDFQKQGYKNVTDKISIRLMAATFNLQFQQDDKQGELNVSPEMKGLLQETKSKRTKLIKRRNEQ